VKKSELIRKIEIPREMYTWTMTTSYRFTGELTLLWFLETGRKYSGDWRRELTFGYRFDKDSPEVSREKK
jgi:hypothetical protein